jgi:hypothetical protein
MPKIVRLFPFIVLGILTGHLLYRSGLHIGGALLPDLALFVVFTYVSIYVHEFGHVVLGKLAGIPIRRVRIGTGRTLFWFRLIGTRVDVTDNMRGGFTIPYGYNGGRLRSRFLLFTLGGVLFQAVASVAALVVRGLGAVGAPHFVYLDFAGVFFIVNALGVVLSVVPYNISVNGAKTANDGMRILRTLFAKEKGLDELLAGAITNDGYVHMLDKEYDLAEHRYREALEKYPDQPVPLINLTASALKLGRADEAIGLLEALKAKGCPRQYDALVNNNLAWAYLLRFTDQSIAHAVDLSALSYKACPDHPSFRGTRGCTLVASGRVEEGLKVLTKQAKLNRRIDGRLNSPEGYLFVAYGHWLLAEKGMALAFLRKIAAYKGELDAGFKSLCGSMAARSPEFATEMENARAG